MRPGRRQPRRFVTGGLGLLAQHYRGQLGNQEIVARILATADRSGEYADSDIYGRGVPRPRRRRPVRWGETRMLTGRSLSGPSAPSHASTLRLGPAFGDSLARGLAQIEVASFDALDAPFFRPLGDHVQPDAFAAPALGERLRALGSGPARHGLAHRRHRAPAAARCRPCIAGRRRVRAVRALASGEDATGAGDPTVSGSLGSLSLAHKTGHGELLFGYRAHLGWRFGPHADGGPLTPGTFTEDGAFANPYLGFARDGAGIGHAMDVGADALRIAAFHGTERRDPGSGQATGVLTEYRFGDTGLAVQAGWLSEAEAALGSRPGGAFGALASDTALAGLSAHRRLADGWSLLASAHAGMSRVENPGHGMVRDMSTLWTGSFAVGLMGEEIDGAGGRLAARLSQPLRVEAGQARLRWVSGRVPDGAVTVGDAALDLAPSGRQIDLELVYARPLAGGEAHLAAIASRDAGHVRGANEAALLARYRLAF